MIVPIYFLYFFCPERTEKSHGTRRGSCLAFVLARSAIRPEPALEQNEGRSSYRSPVARMLPSVAGWLRRFDGALGMYLR
jgi:hypothetical protein